MTASTVVSRPASWRAPAGHASTQAPQAVQREEPGGGAPCSQTVEQVPQETQRVSTTSTSGANDWLSGLWHQGQRAGQPLRKTVVRMPGPSCSE